MNMVPQTKVFVGSLPQGSRPEDLRKLFERFGVVTECDIMNRCGFVHMQTEDEATAAIKGLHNSTFNGAAITVERGRIKERGQRGAPGGRGGMRGGRGGERRSMRGGRDAPYPRDRMGMRDLRNSSVGGMPMRNGGGMGGGYDRGADRPMGGGGYDDRYNGYSGEDRRGFALMDGRAARPDPYAAPAPMYDDRRAAYGGMPMDDMGGMGYTDDRRGMYPDDRDMMDRRAPLRPPVPMGGGGYDRPAVPRQAPGMGNGDMFSRRSDMDRGGAIGGYDRDPYAQSYAQPIGRVGGGRGGRDGGPRRY